MAYSRILLKGDPLQKEGTVRTGQTIYPGMLVDYYLAETTIQYHGTDGGTALPMVALEDNLRGKGVEDAYSAGNRIQFVHLRPGDEFLARIEPLVSLSFGDLIESKGTGNFKKHVPDSSAATITENSIVAKVLEAVVGATGVAKWAKAVAI